MTYCMHGLHYNCMHIYSHAVHVTLPVLAGAAKTAATAERIVRQTNAKQAISILD